ncbi:hypothetical protein I907_gp57 [Bacillus phage Eoghan]|uniref:Uncharacterized protein n=2 Tax=Andromedavirus TaxID=1623275 RepID=M1IQM7_9CAUD|nr:hypothetical protein I907_gp57 [Bacillus phage Eoghan]YP_009592290.1 hypothetical protein FDG68_gp57 [Bacillus phage Taylor]AGE60821.1 hypothetical protein EOGHAN_58 [Bacillus phage Eoghan]AGE60975.1 hypothetical protein TAYLOR_57 [Bacillus phage Taylor]
MSTIRKIVLTQEQGVALNMLLDHSTRNTKDPRDARENSVEIVLHGHTTWADLYKPLNSIPLSDLLYIVTGGAWEIQKTVKGVLEEFKNDSRLSQWEQDGVALAIQKLKEEGLIK